MITKFAKRFADDTTFQDMCKALEEKNVKEAFRMAHTLKGICSNLGFDELYKASYDLTEDLRTVSCQAMSRIMKRSAKNIR